ncbi:MAG TPA: hypothetical protein VFX12_12610 [Vicinamibacterales bacterium]|nr:hypothetical protein [Vicinamibacterales bacterium]
MNLTRPQPRVRPFFRRLAIVCVIVLIPIAAFSLWDYIEARALVSQVQAIARRREPVNIDALTKPLATPEQRESARLYMAAAILASGGDFKDIAFAARRIADIAAAPPDAASPATLDEITRVYERVKPALDLLDRATPLRFVGFGHERPRYAAQTGDVWRLAQLNSLRADVLALRGDPDGAAHALLSGVRLERTLDGPAQRRTFDSVQLLLARTRPSAASLAALQQAYGDLGAKDHVAEWVLKMRAMWLDEWSPRSFDGPTESERLVALGLGVSPVIQFVERPWRAHQARVWLNSAEVALDTARRPWPEKLDVAKRRAAAAGHVLYPPFQFAGFINAGLPHAGFLLAGNRAAVAVLAIERYRRDHGGAPPDTLQQLPPHYVSAVPMDPFSGKALRYLRTPDAYIVYSFGLNRQDDGGDIGAFTPDADLALDEGLVRDIGIRVPLRR